MATQASSVAAAGAASTATVAVAEAVNMAAKSDIASWTARAGNLTQYAPSITDLALAGPRMVMKLGSFAFGTVPEAVDNILNMRFGQREIAQATSTGQLEAIITSGAPIAQGILRTGEDVLVGAGDQGAGIASRFSMESIRSISNIMGYATSKWALGCIFIAIVLNRTTVFASSRRPVALKWNIRLLLRIVPIILLGIQCRSLLQSIQCQTSPDFPELRWHNSSRVPSDFLFVQNSPFLNTVSSTLLLGASDEDSCRAVNMIPSAETEDTGTKKQLTLSGSLPLLWPLFKTFCFSHAVESVSCAMQGRLLAAETGMTLFEHSIAFAEADNAILSQLELAQYVSGTHESKAEVAFNRSRIMNKINTHPEVLMVGFFSAMNHLTSHILGIFDVQGRYRLFNTGVWGLCFMGTMAASLWKDDASYHNLLRFPTVCIIGFIPHAVVLVGILICAAIYAAAVVLAALASQPGENPPQSFMQRLRIAHDNMQASVPLSQIRISRFQDFYTALLKTGFSLLTMASEAVFLNESRGVRVLERTWLEEDRLREIEEQGVRWLGPNFRSLDDNGDGITGGGVGLFIHSVNRSNGTNPLLRERKTEAARKIPTSDGLIRDGVGATERTGRWIMAGALFKGIARLGLHWAITLTVALLGKLGLRAPIWLSRWIQVPKKKRDDKEASKPQEELKFWLIGKNGEMTLPVDGKVDVEAEMRNRLHGQDARDLDEDLYGWWKAGGYWGDKDGSGNFVPPQHENDESDIDNTSVVSTTDDGWESDRSFDDGERTPTQGHPHFSREATPDDGPGLDPVQLARLLAPKTRAEEEEARALAAHLTSTRTMTRSQYAAQQLSERSKVLTSNVRYRPASNAHATASGSSASSSMREKMMPEEEAQILEQLIITRREQAKRRAASSSADSWAAGAAGLGEGGPQCVVCQSAPRSVILWPCRCLSLCDDCRVTLAMKNFDKCPCCRRDVNSFSRIFTP